MWGNARRRNAKIDTLVGGNTVVTGDVRFEGGLHVDGTIKGNVLADPDGEAMLSISENGAVEGEVRVPHIALNGRVTGDVYATDRVELGPKAHVDGNLYYNLIEMAAGAQVNGKLVHRPKEAPRLLKHERKEDEDEPARTGSGKA